MNMIDRGDYLNSCELVTLVSTIACSIAKCYDTDELALIGAIFTQLGDTLAVISLREEQCTKDS